MNEDLFYVAIRYNAGYGGSGNRRAGSAVYEIVRHMEGGGETVTRMVDWFSENGAEARTLTRAYPGIHHLQEVSVTNGEMREIEAQGRRAHLREEAKQAAMARGETPEKQAESVMGTLYEQWLESHPAAGQTFADWLLSSVPGAER